MNQQIGSIQINILDEKGNHIHIDFIKFLIERNSIPETDIPDEDEVKTPGMDRSKNKQQRDTRR